MNNVIPFDNKVTVKVVAKTKPMTCRHRRSLVLDPDSRTLQCEDCGAFVDSFDVLSGIVNREIRLTSSLEYLTCEVKKLRNEKHDLDKEVKRLKAQRRYHKNKLRLPADGVYQPGKSCDVPPPAPHKAQTINKGGHDDS